MILLGSGLAIEPGVVRREAVIRKTREIAARALDPRDRASQASLEQLQDFLGLPGPTRRQP